MTNKYEGWTDEELVQEIEDIAIERERRRTVAEAESRIINIALQYQESIGRKNGDDWVQPTGAHDAYQSRSVVTHNNKTWESLVNGNVWEPGVSGWRELVEGEVPDWIQPTGAHDAYNTGDMAKWEAVVRTSLIDGNVWSPADSPENWGYRDGEGDAPVEDGSESEEEPDNGTLFWIPGESVSAGDRREYEGVVYECVQGHNTQAGWEPPNLPALWKVVEG